MPAEPATTKNGKPEFAPAFEDVGPFRRLRIIKTGFGEKDTPDYAEFYIRELGARQVFGLTAQIRTLLNRLEENRKEKDGEKDGQVTLSALDFNSILDLISKSADDIYQLVCSCVFKDTDCKTPIKESDILSIGELAILVRGVIEVNWNRGSLKKALWGLGLQFGTGNSTPTPSAEAE